MTETRTAGWLRTGALALVIPLLILVLAACDRPAFLDAELPDDGPPVATSQAAAMRFAEKAANAAESAADSKRLNLTISQEEVTSFLDLGSIMSEQLGALGIYNMADLQALEGSAELAAIEGLPAWLDVIRSSDGKLELNPRVSIREPEVRFQGNGHIIVRGYAEALGQRQPLRLVLAPRASEGEMVLDFVEGNLGPVEIPEGLIDTIGSWLVRILLLGEQYVAVEEITVTNGRMTIRGGYQG
jgi:hypothetical protein